MIEPSLLMDKSSVQCLNSNESRFIDRYYTHVISPILVREIQSDLTEEGKDLSSLKNKVKNLSAKANAYSGLLLPHAIDLAYNNFLGVEIPLDGRIPMKGIPSRSKDGRKGMSFIDAPKELQNLRQWANNDFPDEHIKTSKEIQQIDASIDLAGLLKNIAKEDGSLQKYKSIDQVVDFVDYYLNGDSKLVFLAAVNEILQGEHVNETIIRWEASGCPILKEFAPYAFYYFRVNLIFLLCIDSGLIRSGRNAHIHLDMQYIHYLPFCRIFCSGDKDLEKMARVFMREDQRFIKGMDLKNDLKKLDEFFTGLSEEQEANFYLEYNNYPPDISGSFTSEIWKEWMAPRSERKIKTTPNEENKILRECKLIQESVALDTNLSIDPSVKPRYDHLSAKEKFFAIYEKLVGLFGLNSGKKWEHVKKEISETQVKDFYDFYGDLWRPDSDIWKTYTRNKSQISALYVGDIDPYSIYRAQLGFLLYFDKVFIVDPFVNPWSYKEEMNPIANSALFESDLLKVFFMLIETEPWHGTGEIEFIQDPTNFCPKFKWDCFSEATKRGQSRSFNLEEFKESEIMRLQADLHTCRFLARLPLNNQKAQIKKMRPNTSDQEIDEIIKKCRADRSADPLAIDRDFVGIRSDKKGDLLITRMAPNLELLIILSRLNGLLPLVYSAVRKNELLNSKCSKEKNRWSRFLEKINSYKFKYFENLDADFSLYLKSKGYLTDFRDFVKRLYNELHAEEYCKEEIVKAFTEELNLQLEKLDKEWAVIENEIESWNSKPFVCKVAETKLVFDICEEGYQIPSADDLIKKFVKTDLKTPRLSMFIQIPIFPGINHRQASSINIQK